MKAEFLITGLFILLLAGCDQSAPLHFISDEDYRDQVEQAYNTKKAFFTDTTLFSIFTQDITRQEREAMMFLYAYMPVGDIADYTGEFYLKNVQSSFRVQQEMPWGKNIPETIFRHFVLPVRVNNENMDESRMVFYEELKDRVKGLSLYDAVLEVNHWCHEKVIYTPSDARTSAPLASVKTAYGRCGEESTFTVAALRSVGIPARQIYIPRWAHTDDNHAWVEAWVDGKWYFLGACEPEPVLNLAWFNAPAYRGMLMHTKVFGAYMGPEEVMERTDCYTEINVINNYAPTAKAVVTVVNEENQPLKDTQVEFKIYNYAEFYTVARKISDEKGQCSLSAGKGDMIVWATQNDRFGYGKITFGKDEEITIVINKSPGDEVTLELDIVPPVDGSIPVVLTEEQKNENTKRLMVEDSIRNQYVSTFYTPERANELAKDLNIDPGKATDYLLKSRGNWKEIELFLRNTPEEKRSKAIALLSVVSAKDLRDTPASVLYDHLNNTTDTSGIYKSDELFKSEFPAKDMLFYSPYVLNPRVSNELLTSYKEYFIEYMDSTLRNQLMDDPQVLVAWVKKNITIKNEWNPQHIPVTPIGVWKTRIADAHSRDIFFVALARTLGFISRIDPVTGKVQYYDTQWIDVNFETKEQMNALYGKVVASYQSIKALKDPKYYAHFTIAAIHPDGELQTLNFQQGSSDMGEGVSWSNLLKQPLDMETGNYLLVTGTRMASGKVLARITSFTVKPDETISVGLVMRESTDDVQVIGNIDAEATFGLADSGQESTILNTTGRGYFVVAILGSRQEPTNHAMRDIAQAKDDFEQWGRKLVLLFKDEQSLQLFDKHEFGNLPETITYGVDIDNNITNMLVEAMKLPNADNLPIFVIADTFGRVVFVSQGYTIGLGQQMMHVIHKL